ncbi:ATP-grasp domain-containing protein, partial [Deinococcus pimensis]|uniref:ATP-grasp domain-containing protein n=1 Tax=Deinococcus pimensis TaxID=309888 RepID=UPI0012F8418B
APFVRVESAADLRGALAAVGGAGLLKTSELGYDGKGQARVSSQAELDEAFARFGVPCVLEGLVPFTRELSLSVARSPSGEVAFSGLVENTHAGGVLRRSVFPAAGAGLVEARARS